MICMCMHAHSKSWVGTSYDIRIQVSSDISWLMERGRLDRRRLEAAHMKDGVLSVASWYPCDIGPAEIAFSSDLEQTLLGYTPVFQHAFHKKYSSVTYSYIEWCKCSSQWQFLYTHAYRHVITFK